MSIYGSINEGYIKNEPDIYYNKEKFDSGEINLCFITGHSGSGKSTMGRNMANKDSKVEHYELDDVVWNKETYTMENLKEYGDLIYTFFKGPGKKYYFTNEDVRSGKVKPYKGQYEKDLIIDFVDYAIKFSNSHKNIKYVLEGIWIIMFIEPSKLKDFAVYIKGTSLLVSNFRAAKRDSKSQYKDNKIKEVKMFLRRFILNNDNRLKLEKDLKKYRDYFSNLMDKEN